MKFIIDNKIPFIKGRLESFAETIYADPGEIDREMARDADALVVRTRTRCDGPLLAGTGVGMVVTATIGTDHIDLGWCRSNGVEVRNAAGCNAPGVAQYVWASLLRKGFDPRRATIGVVGLGNVGSIVADWGERLGCRVLACDPPREEAGFSDREYLPLETLLREADAVTLHTPLTRSGNHPTFHLIGERELELMKPEAILINSSRGPVADNAAWARRLGKGKGRAFVDVWEGEPAIHRPLLELAEIATPHIAGYSFEGKQRATRMALEALGSHFGFTPDISGLQGQYESPTRPFSDSDIRLLSDSYDPEADTLALRADPESFETLRSNYNYRKEPDFKQNGI